MTWVTSSAVAFTLIQFTCWLDRNDFAQKCMASALKEILEENEPKIIKKENTEQKTWF